MNALRHHEKPGIDYIMIVILAMYWVIFILEALARK
jgi:hypothetical protein